MNWDQVEGNWKQMSGVLAKKWGKLTGDDLAVAKGNMNILAGKLQERYGLAKEEAERQLNDFISGFQGHAEGNGEVAKEGAPVDTQTLKIGM